MFVHASAFKQIPFLILLKKKIKNQYSTSFIITDSSNYGKIKTLLLSYDYFKWHVMPSQGWTISSGGMNTHLSSKARHVNEALAAPVPGPKCPWQNANMQNGDKLNLSYFIITIKCNASSPWPQCAGGIGFRLTEQSRSVLCSGRETDSIVLTLNTASMTHEYIQNTLPGTNRQN